MGEERRNVLLAMVAICLVVVPLVVGGWLLKGTEWTGADMQSSEAVENLAGDGFRPWFEPLFLPGNMERYLFGLQAFIGSGLASGFLGWLLGHRQKQQSSNGRRILAAGIATSGVGVLVAIALFFVETDFGELQAFLSATQGIGLGLTAFMVGYTLGKRDSVQS